MLCMNCSLEVPIDYVFAIQNNACPRCGEDIMPPKKLEQYLALVGDLKSNISLTDDDALNEAIVDRVSSYFLEHYYFEKQQRLSRKSKKFIKPAAIEEEEDLTEEDKEILAAAIPASPSKILSRRTKAPTTPVRRVEEEE